MVARQKKTSINTRLPQHAHLAIIERQSKVIRPKEMPMDYIKISNAREGCLKNVSLEIPKNQLVVFTGLSGCGKSTLLIDVLFNECQRQYLEAMSFQGIRKPKVDRIRGASPAIVITQTDANRNPRSTVGTLSDIYTDLRMIYEKLGMRTCPYCGHQICAADCREETRKEGTDFHVYMYCSECGQRMDKITRTFFSFNTREGACPACEGLGHIHAIDKSQVIDENLSLEDGAVRYWEKRYGQYQISLLFKAFQYYRIPYEASMPVKDFTDLQKAILYEGTQCAQAREAFPGLKPPETTASGRFEGVFPILWRRLSERFGDVGSLTPYFTTEACPNCGGERLGTLSRSVTVHGTRLPELNLYSLEHLWQWIKELRASLSPKHLDMTESYLLDIETKLDRYQKVGLGYLCLDRQIITLSGGELKRLRLAAALDSELTGIIYILDEPTAGLHSKDTPGLVAILKKLRDLGNTVLVIEHDTDIMESADHIIDMGPGAGRVGGEIIASGTLKELMRNPASVTGLYLKNPDPGKSVFREPTAMIRIEHANAFNLKDLAVDIPVGCLTSVTGPSGSGKSTLLFEVLSTGGSSKNGRVAGLERFDKIVRIEQAAIPRMKRSNVATYADVYTDIRSVFGKTGTAKKNGLCARHFSFNSSGGRCENCEGLGYIDNNMLFFANTEIVCPVCNGSQFRPEVLEVTYKGASIKDVLNLSIEEAAELFADVPKILRILNLLMDVGLSYLQLGQSLTTLSGGECQRLRLAKELIQTASNKECLYLMDEPTAGLHPSDIRHFLALLDRLADAGNTIVAAEHNQQFISHSDWMIDLGPVGGEKGGYLMYAGTPKP